MKKFFISLFVAIASITLAQLPDGLKFDDGFTWLECHQFETVQNNVLTGSWVLESNVRIWGDVPVRSGFKFVLKKDGKEVSSNMTDGFPVAYGEDKAMVILGFWKDKQRTTLAGNMTVDVFYIDGNTNKEYLAKTLKIDVRRISRTRASVGKREPYADAFLINRHAEVLSTILHFRDYEYPSYTGLNLTRYSARMLELVMNYSTTQDGSSPNNQGRIALEVNGKPVPMMVPNNQIPQDGMGNNEQAGFYNIEHSDRDAAKYFNSGPYYRDRVGFCRRIFVLPLQWGPQLQGREKWNVFTNDHPGDYKVTYLIDRKPVRIWRFKIGVDGLPVPHEEQKNGLYLGPRSVLVETEIPEDGGEFDGRLNPTFVKEGAFFGRAWTTAAMKNLAAKVPTKGRPFPVSSAKLGG